MIVMNAEVYVQTVITFQYTLTNMIVKVKVSYLVKAKPCATSLKCKQLRVVI